LLQQTKGPKASVLKFIRSPVGSHLPLREEIIGHYLYNNQ
jgi:hypothetical protein